MKFDRGKRRRFRRSWRALVALADHFIAGPDAIYLPEGSGLEGRWLRCNLSLEKTTSRDGPRQQFQIYELPRVWKRALEGTPTLPLVRRVVWDFAADRERLDERRINETSFMGELFRTDDASCDLLHDQTLRLDRALPSHPFQEYGLPLELPADPNEGIRIADSEQPRLDASTDFYLMRVTDFTVVELSWEAGRRNDLNDAFLALWDSLGVVCSPANDVTSGGWKQSWGISPEDYLTVWNTYLANT